MFSGLIGYRGTVISSEPGPDGGATLVVRADGVGDEAPAVKAGYFTVTVSVLPLSQCILHAVLSFRLKSACQVVLDGPPGSATRHRLKLVR